MNNKIMGLIELAMQFKEGDRMSASVEFGSHIDGVTVCVSKEGSIFYRETCYLNWEGVDEKLNSMRVELEGYLKQNLREVV